MGNDFRLSRRPLWIVAQQLRGAFVQRLAAALEQAVVGGVLDQRMLEAIAGYRWRALDKEEVGLASRSNEACSAGSSSSATSRSSA